MKRIANKMLSSVATFATTSLVVASAATVAAQRYTYDYSVTDAAGAGGFAIGMILIYCCALCIPLLIVIGLAVWVYKDAQKNKVDNAALWAILTFFTGLIGILIYLLAIRPDAIKKMESEVKKA